jgi:hypothetical protein
MEATALKLVPETEEVGVKALSIVDQSKALKIVDSETYIKAGSILTTIKDMIKEVESTFTPICEAAFLAHRKAVEKRDGFLNPLKDAQKGIKGAMSNYDLERERERLAEQRRIEEEQRKAEEERKLLEAIEAEQNGEQEVAEEILKEEVYIPPVVLPKATPKVQGVSFRTIWDFEIVNASLIPRQFLSPDLVKIGGVVRSLKEATQIPGIKVFSKRV